VIARVSSQRVVFRTAFLIFSARSAHMDTVRRFGLSIGLVVVLASLGMYTQVSANPPSNGFVSAATDDVSTASVAYSQVPGLGGSIEARENSCVVATFSSQVFRGSDITAVLFKAILDDREMEPGDIGHFLPSGAVETFAFTFWTCGVPKGAHTVTVLWRSDTGYEVKVRKRTLVAEVK
jgi:hypothetical protein